MDSENSQSHDDCCRYQFDLDEVRSDLRPALKDKSLTAFRVLLLCAGPGSASSWEIKVFTTIRYTHLAGLPVAQNLKVRLRQTVG